MDGSLGHRARGPVGIFPTSSRESLRWSGRGIRDVEFFESPPALVLAKSICGWRIPTAKKIDSVLRIVMQDGCKPRGVELQVK